MFDYTSGSGQTVTGIHLSPPREGGYIVFHENSFLFQGSNEIGFDFFLGGTVSREVRITEISLYYSLVITSSGKN
jgi:hypothetical protein